MGASPRLPLDKQLPASAQVGPLPRAARSLMLERSRLPVAGSGGMAWRRSQTATAPVSPASVLAGAIASGWSPPKAKAPSMLSRLRADGAVAADQALVSSMALRMSQVEKLNQQQVATIIKQAQELEALRTEVAQLR